jgi:hypothetical protein
MHSVHSPVALHLRPTISVAFWNSLIMLALI